MTTATITCGECGNAMNLSTEALRVGIKIECGECHNTVIVMDRFVGDLNGPDASGEFKLIPDVKEIARVDGE